MNTDQQTKLYHEAMRYMDNASKMLSENGKKKDGLYHDIKYVQVACGTAYLGLLLATECYLQMKGNPVVKNKEGRIHVEQYREKLGKVDRKALNCFNNAYQILHLDGYYSGMNRAGVLKGGFDSAMEIFNRIAPPGIRHTTELD